MTGHDFKKPGLIRAGFNYQDLVAIEVLIDFYKQRDRYEWVQVDTEDKEFRSIDDVVAFRPDNQYELTQVKFTGNPQEASNGLSWAWLTAKSGQGTSLLQKWSATVLLHDKAGTLAKAVLKTNRIPDAAIARYLDGSKIEYSRLTDGEKTIVLDQQARTGKRGSDWLERYRWIRPWLTF